MTITFSDEAKQAGEQYGQLQHASSQLEEVLGQSTGLVKAHWDRTEDEKGRTLYLLQLKDPFGEVTGAFAPAELQSPNQMYFRLYRLWGDLLQAQTKQQLQELAGN